jgi:hypothetical protein
VRHDMEGFPTAYRASGVNTPGLVVSTYHSTVPVLVHPSFLSSSNGMIDGSV